MTHHQLGSEARPLRVAIIGSGPSGFYAAEALFKADDLVADVDIFDRLPTPFGLVRGGVAPDHQKIKSVTRIYDKIAQHPRFRFFGNVKLGRDVQVDDLRAHYDHIIYAVGNESDRMMGIPGEDLAGVHSATAFVGWYNGHPDFVDLKFDLENAERVAVIGNGNVAMDVARVLAQRPDRLADTDIAGYALDALRRSKVREVLLLGRRGPAQAAFSPKEIQEVGELEGCDLLVDPTEVALDEVTLAWLEKDAPRPAHRNVRYLTEQSTVGSSGAERGVRCRFLVSPVEFVGDDGKVTGVRLQHNELYRSDDGTPRPRAVDRFDTEECQLVFEAIGYRGDPLPGVPFDERRGIISNEAGRVVDGNQPVPGEYVVGWAKRGPTGLIGNNSPDSKATVAMMLEDLAGKTAEELPHEARDAMPRLLTERGIDFVTFEDWQHLDAHEIERGQPLGKIRDKLTAIPAMLEAIRARRE